MLLQTQKTAKILVYVAWWFQRCIVKVAHMNLIMKNNFIETKLSTIHRMPSEKQVSLGFAFLLQLMCINRRILLFMFFNRCARCWRAWTEMNSQVDWRLPDLVRTHMMLSVVLAIKRAILGPNNRMRQIVLSGIVFAVINAFDRQRLGVRPAWM